MAWQDGYLQAKFRNVPFFIKRATYDTGRRNIKHIYPRKDEVDHEDNGQDDKTITLDAYLLGDDYFDQRTRFEKALDAGGEGVLIHPYRGVLNVVVDRYSEVEANERGRAADYTINFSIQKIVQLTSAAPNTRWQLSAAKDNFITAYKDNALDIYSLLNKPAQAVADARAVLDKGLSVIEAAKKVAGSIAAFKRELENTKGRFIAAINNIEYLTNTFTDLVNFGTDLTDGLSFGVNSSNAKDQIREQKQISTISSAVLVDTPSDYSDDPDWPSRQLQDMIGYASLAARIGMVSEVPYETLEDATAGQKDLFDDINAVMEKPNISDDMFEALREAKRAAFADLQSRVINLPSIINYDSPQTTNSISLCFALYGSLDNEQDLIDRNGIIHPGFIPAVPLQIKVGNE